MSYCTKLVVALLITMSYGCATAQAPSDEELLIKAAALTKFAAALESAVRFKDAPQDLSEEQLMEFATRHDPGLLEPFHEFTLRVRRIRIYSSVLVCSKDGSIGLIEDAGCTARLDAKLWELRPQVSCAFQLDLEEVCSRR